MQVKNQSLRRIAVAASIAVAGLVGAINAHAAPAVFAAEGGGVVCPVGECDQGTFRQPVGVTGKQSTFLSGLSSFTKEEFNNPSTAPFNPGAILGGHGSITGGGIQSNSFDGQTHLGRWNTTADMQGSARGWYENTTDPTSVMEITLLSLPGQNAVGFYLTDYGDFGSSIELVIDGLTVSKVGPVNTDGNVVDPSGSDPQVLFFGYYSDSVFSSVKLKFTQPGGGNPVICDPLDDACIPARPADVVGLDSLIIGVRNTNTSNRAPEPGSLALLGLGLLAASRIKRRSN